MLREAGIPAIAGVDTRALARHLRSNGCLRAIVTAPGQTDPDEARDLARGAALGGPGFRGPGIPGTARDEGEAPRGARSWQSSTSASRRTSSAASASEGRASECCLTRPRRPSARSGCRRRGFSPGPGDPARLDGPVALARAAIADGRPLLGICLGHQIIGRAAGAQTRRLPFGHHAANHPVKDIETGLVQVTAQNHEVTVIADTLPEASGFVVSQIDLNDGSVEGLRHRRCRSRRSSTTRRRPGPLDALAVFDRFVSAARARHGGAAPEPTVGRVEPIHLDTAVLQRRLRGGK